jgi:hypothetical protein
VTSPCPREPLLPHRPVSPGRRLLLSKIRKYVAETGTDVKSHVTVLETRIRFFPVMATFVPASTLAFALPKIKTWMPGTSVQAGMTE